MRYEDIGAMFGQAAGLDFSKDGSSFRWRTSQQGHGDNSNQIYISTAYRLLIDRLRGARQQAAARLYEIIISNPYTKSAAGYMLDGEYHGVLCKGGQWQISPMKAN